jgi:hypothetical protein
MCEDLTPGESGFWSPFQGLSNGKQVLLRDLQRQAPRCPSSGCKILFNAVTKYLPNAIDDEVELYSMYSTHGVFGVHLLKTGERHSVQLFVTEGTFCATDFTWMRCADRGLGQKHPVWPAIVRSSYHHDLSSDDSITFIRDLLQTCAREHQACRLQAASQQGFMPRRVLDIGITDDGSLEALARAPVKLVESSEIEEERIYVSLSHRWSADGHTIVTKQSTYEEHRSGIAFKDLDTLYQDAVHVLRRLGFRYLWIDSLCIIQDDLEDWRVESKTMAKVYGQALFTFAWQSGMTAPISIRSLTRQCHLVSDPHISPLIFARAHIPHIWETRGYLVRFPLSSRGWVYQERLLSRRVVHFTEHEIMWECNQSQTCQCGWADRGTEFDGLIRPKPKHASVLGLVDPTAEPNTHDIRRRWRQIISEFSKLKLTYAGDRLPAIEGCAEQIGKVLTDVSLFGLWKGGLLGDLLWHTEDSWKRFAGRPPALFHLPTWSWASVNGDIEHYVASEEYARVELTHAEHDGSKGQEPQYLIVTSKAVPARLRFAWQPGDIDRVEIEVDERYLRAGLGIWRGVDFKADFSLRSHEWVEGAETWAISILRLAKIGMRDAIFGRDCCLIVWTYGKAIPGSGALRSTKDKHPIHQRVGTLATLKNPSGQTGTYEPNQEPVIDWDRVKDITIALE